MAMEGKLPGSLYLFTSIAQQRYAVDALNVLALPHGWIIRFRYDRPYVQPELWKEIPEGSPGANGVASRLTGMLVIASYVNQSEATPTARRRHRNQSAVEGLFPLRTGTLARAFRDGDIAYFWFAVGDYLRYLRKDAGEAKHEHEHALDEALEGKTPYGGVYAALGETYGLVPIGPANAAEAFQTIVDVIGGQGFEKQATVFAQFHGMKKLEDQVDVEGREAEPPARGLMPSESAYKLRDEETYALDISAYNVDVPDRRYFPDAALECLFDADHFVALGGTSSGISGRYDRFSFPLVVRRHTKDQWTAITVRATPGVTRKDVADDGKESFDRFLGVEWTIPVLIEVDKWKRRGVRGAHVLAELFVAGGTSLLVVAVALLRSPTVGLPGPIWLWIALAFVCILLGAVLRVLLPSRD